MLLRVRLGWHINDYISAYICSVSMGLLHMYDLQLGIICYSLVKAPSKLALRWTERIVGWESFHSVVDGDYWMFPCRQDHEELEKLVEDAKTIKKTSHPWTDWGFALEREFRTVCTSGQWGRLIATWNNIWNVMMRERARDVKEKVRRRWASHRAWWIFYWEHVCRMLPQRRPLKPRCSSPLCSTHKKRSSHWHVDRGWDERDSFCRTSASHQVFHRGGAESTMQVRMCLLYKTTEVRTAQPRLTFDSAGI